MIPGALSDLVEDPKVKIRSVWPENNPVLCSY